MNNTCILGNMVRDPRPLQSEVAAASFTLAVDRRYKNAKGEKVTDFIDCIAWRQNASYVIDRCKKGDLVEVIGEIHSRRSAPLADGRMGTVHEVEVIRVKNYAGRPATDAYMGDPEPPAEDDDGPLPFSL